MTEDETPTEGGLGQRQGECNEAAHRRAEDVRPPACNRAHDGSHVPAHLFDRVRPGAVRPVGPPETAEVDRDTSVVRRQRGLLISPELAAHAEAVDEEQGSAVAPGLDPDADAVTPDHRHRSGRRPYATIDLGCSEIP